MNWIIFVGWVLGSVLTGIVVNLLRNRYPSNASKASEQLGRDIGYVITGYSIITGITLGIIYGLGLLGG